MLGVSIGIFSISFVNTLVGTIESEFRRSLERLGNTVLFVHHRTWGPPKGSWEQMLRWPPVDPTEYERLRRSVRYVEAMAFAASTRNATIRNDRRSISGAQVGGVTEQYLAVMNLSVGEGRYFTGIEHQAGRKVCVIGAEIADGLFDGASPLGRDIRLNGQRVRVVGVYQKTGTSIGFSPDQVIHVPYRTMCRLYNVRHAQVDRMVAIRVVDARYLNDVEAEIGLIMRRIRQLRDQQLDNFAINRQDTLLGDLQSVLDALRSGGLFISLFSILVGGFGIANIMFVSVKERTSEIGIQMALGASRPFILAQFLLESMVLCLLGGLLGLLLIGVSAAIAQAYLVSVLQLDVQINVSASTVISAILVSVGIGLVFGFLPANTAARLDPVEAMRQQ